MAFVAVARACGVTATLLSVFVLTVLSVPGVMAENVRLSPDYEISSDAYLLSSVEGADAATVLTRFTDTTWGDPDTDDTLPGVNYPGDEYDGDPGCLYWGNRTVLGGGVYGTATIKVGLTDIVGASSDYWSFDAIIIYELVDHVLPFSVGDSYPNTFSNTLNCSIRVGFGSGSYSGWNDSVTYPGSVGSTYPVGYPQAGGYHYDIMNDGLSRPWTTAEINAGYVIITMRMDLAVFDTSDWPVSMVLGGIQMQVQSETYTGPPDPSAYSFILYPNDDISNYQWHPVPTDDLFDNLNETTHFGDATTTYIRASWDYLANYRFEFDDPPDDALTGTYYAVTAYMVAKENVSNSNDQLGLHIGSLVYSGSAFTPWVLAEESLYYDLSTSWTNYSTAWTRPGGDQGSRTTTNWSLSQLANVTGRLSPTGSDPYGGICVTQVALLCTPTSVVPATEIPGEGMIGWIADGGIKTILGIMGALMLVMGPTIILVKGREDDGTLSGYFVGVLIVVMGIGFLYAGLAGHWV
jgi:hypothetical protein